jgi:ketosteroid isomerase-like protein
MSQEPVTPLPGAAERDVLDRLLVRVPALAGAASGGLNHLRPGSPLRRRLVNVQVKRAFAAMARSDVEVVLLGYEPQAEVWMRSMAGVGINDCSRGYEGIRTLYADLDEAFDDWGWTARAVVDGGDRLAVRTDFVGRGRGSGVETAVNDGGTAVKLSARGRVVWQEWFTDQQGWKKALEAVGLSE